MSKLAQSALAALAVGLVALAQPSFAQDMPAPNGAKPARALLVLAPEDIDPARLLPPPPEHGSSAEKAELAELHDIQDHRNGSRFDQAKWDDVHEDWTLYAAVLGFKFDLANLPATAKVLSTVQNDQSIAANRAKAYFKRQRPWAVDPTIKGCDYKPTDNPLTSYPSGHTVVGFSLGVVLADLIPEKAGDLLARANEYGYSRLVCGLHYRSDTVASQTLGTVVAVEMLHSPAFQADLAAARAELKAAGFTK